MSTSKTTNNPARPDLRLANPCLKGNITPTGSIIPRLQEVEDLQGDDLLYYDAEMELTNMILLSIPNEIYNSVDSCKTAKEMWDRVERLMRGTIQNQVDRETRFTNEFDQFVAEPGESLVSVYNRFAQLMNDLERNNMKFPTVSFNDLFDYLSQFEKLVNASRAKKLEKSHDPLALVAHTGSSSRNTSSYYVTHPSSVVDYDEEYEQDDVHNHSEDPLASAMLVNIQSINSGNVGRNNRRAYVQEEVVKGMNATNETANCALETLASHAYAKAAKQQRFAQKVQQQNMTLTSQIEMYKERNQVLENINKDNNYLKEFLEADKEQNVFKNN
ncbi:hypothetical protein Tco_0655745 [Tanacetum coccineum]|uniref:Uncharacterized protein n=1 Tax=Tanacetum coccineum TaxID=301880 RepID=A0ABQ4X821_9ASTR